MYRGAMRVILSELVRQGRLVVTEQSLNLETPKTKSLLATLNALNLKDVLILDQEFNVNTFLASRNLVNVCYLEVAAVNPLDLISYEKVLVTKDVVTKLEEMFK